MLRMLDNSERHRKEDRSGYSSDDEDENTNIHNKVMNFNLRTNSPTPICKRGSLLDALKTFNHDKEMAMTYGQMNNTSYTDRQQIQHSAREVDENYEGEIPDTPSSELPPTFNEISERKRVAEDLLLETMDKHLSYFYQEMNETASRHGLTKSNFAVAHGMHHYNNYSSALDIAKLSRVALAQHPMLVEIVNTKEYSMTSRINRSHTYEWTNTNFILWQDDPCGTFSGIKTGVTPTAGPCLAVCFKSFCGLYDFIIVVMNCKSREARFVEIPKLARWAMTRISKVKQSNLRPGVKRRLLRNMAHV